LVGRVGRSLHVEEKKMRKAMDCKEYAWILLGARKGYVKETLPTTVMEMLLLHEGQKIVVSVEQECPFSRRVGKSEYERLCWHWPDEARPNGGNDTPAVVAVGRREFVDEANVVMLEAEALRTISVLSQRDERHPPCIQTRPGPCHSACARARLSGDAILYFLGSWLARSLQ
jgi:hypothetical protein